MICPKSCNFIVTLKPEFTGGINCRVENLAKHVNFIALQFETTSRIISNEPERKKLAKRAASSILKTLDLVKI
jgi:hypothetical protein